MAALEIISLNTVTPQLRAPGTGDTYAAPRALSLTPEAVTGSGTTSSLNIAQTWNTSGAPTAFKLNVINTASASNSLLMDVQVGGTSRFSVATDTTNALTVQNTSAATLLQVSDTAITGNRALVLNQTWNNAGTTFQGIDFTITDTASGASSNAFRIRGGSLGTTTLFSVSKGGAITAGRIATAGTQALPVLGISESGQTGFYGEINGAFSYGGTSRGTQFSFAPNGELTLGYSGSLKFVSGAATPGGGDTVLTRDAANTLAQRNGGTGASPVPQTFRVYNYSDGANFERGKIEWSSNVLRIGTEKGGTGTARALEFQTDGVTRLTIAATTGTVSGATAYTTTGGAVVGQDINVAATRAFYWTSGAALFSTGVGIVCFEGRTSSFPALKRSSATLQVRLADDSANAALESASVKTDAPAGGTSGTWKLGVAATVTPTSPNRTIEVDIGGTIYYIHAKTTND